MQDHEYLSLTILKYPNAVRDCSFSSLVERNSFGYTYDQTGQLITKWNKYVPKRKIVTIAIRGILKYLQDMKDEYLFSQSVYLLYP